jgi:hypothetical protein
MIAPAARIDDGPHRRGVQARRPASISASGPVTQPGSPS